MAGKKIEPKQADPTPTPEPAAPSYVPSDEFKRFQESIENNFAQFQQNFNMLAETMRHPANPTPTAPAAPDFSEEELETALAEGKNAKAFLKAIDAKLGGLRGEFSKQVDEIRNVGLTAITDLARDSHEASISEDLKPYVSKYKKEIDAYIANIPPQMRTSKQVYGIACNAVIGAHMPEIIKEEREKALRSASDPNAPGLPGQAGGRSRAEGTTEVPTVEELLGKPAADALASKGQSADDFARKISGKRGFKGWADYVAWFQKKEEGEQQNG